MKTYASAKKKLDAVFSQYIRRKEAFENGMNKCVSCGVERHWKELQCGHFVSRVHLALRWDEKNCHPQCPKCNVLLRGNAVGYARFLGNRYGSRIFIELDEKRKVSVKYSKSDLIEMIKDYEQRLEEL